MQYRYVGRGTMRHQMMVINYGDIVELPIPLDRFFIPVETAAGTVTILPVEPPSSGPPKAATSRQRTKEE